MLFESKKAVNIPLKDGNVFYDPCFFDNKEADHYFEILKLLQEKGANLGLKDYRGRTVTECLEHFAGRKL